MKFRLWLLYQLWLSASMLFHASAPARPVIAGERTRIVVLTSQDSAPSQALLTGFQQTLRQQGHDAEYEFISLQNDATKAPAALNGIKQEGAALILTLGTLATRTAVQANFATPLLASLILNTEEIKLAPNATAVTLGFPVETQLQWLHHLLPEQKTVGVLFNPGENVETIRLAQQAAPGLGLTLVPHEVHSPQELPDALERVARRADVLWGISDSVVLTPQTAEPVLLFSFRNRLPFIGLSTSWVKAGALYALDRDYADIGAQCAVFALKILRGERASNLSAQSPRKVQYALNLKTAAHMKIDLPPALINSAHQVFP
jgi:putative ABC transport system substrate-binding protein